jgi:hypothetical protein
MGGNPCSRAYRLPCPPARRRYLGLLPPLARRSAAVPVLSRPGSASGSLLEEKVQLVSSRCSAAEGPADDGVRRVPGPERGGVLWLQQLMGRAVLGPEKQHLGHVRDLAVRRSRAGALVSGVVVDAGGEQFLVPAESVRTWGEAGVALLLLTSRGRCRRRNEVFLAADLLGQPVLGGADGRLPRITDVALRCTADGWAVEAVDTRGPFRRLLRASRRVIDWDVLVARRVLTRPVAVHRRRAGA